MDQRLQWNTLEPIDWENETVPLLAEEKKAVMAEYRASDNDTGSSELQVAVLTKRIEQLSGHLKSNPKDFASRRGLLQMVGRRRRLLNYLQRRELDRYRAIVAKLGLRK